MAWHWYRGKLGKVGTRWNRVPAAPQQVRLEALYAWERRCRGYDLFPEPVALEPGFVPYEPHLTAEQGGWGVVPQPLYQAPESAALSLLLPQEQKVTPGQMATLFSSLRALRFPLSLEIIGDERSIRYQIVCAKEDEESVIAAFKPCFGDARFEIGRDALLDALAPILEEPVGHQVVDFGLYHPVYQPLRLFETFTQPPHNSLLGVLGSLRAGRVAGLQILATPAEELWGDSLAELVAEFSAERPAHPNTSDSDYARALRYKLTSPLWSVALRVFAVVPRNSHNSEPYENAFEQCRALGGALGYIGEANSNGLLTNSLMALDDESYDAKSHLFDVLERRSRRAGMLLSHLEMLGLWHPPTETMQHPRLVRFDPHYRELPDYLRDAPGAYLGTLAPPELASSSQETPFVPWPDSFRNRHAYMLGATRMGKSTLLLNLIAQDMLAGRGLCLIDPHGDLAYDLLERIPPEREEDVLFLDLSDTAFPPAIGLLEAEDDWEKRLLVSDLLAILHRLFRASWGDRLEHILRHAVLTLLADESQGHTLGDIRPLLSNKPYRELMLRGVHDPGLRAFWHSEFSGYAATAFAPVYNKLGLLMSSPVVRNIIANTQSKLRPAEAIQNRQILIVNLAQSLIGEDNAHFLGALLVSKIQLAAMHNLRRGRGERVPFTLYVDEFQNFVVSSFEKILSEAGKAGLTLVMANQFLEQLSEGLQKGILSNVGTLVSFRVSAESGRTLQGEFGGLFGAKELTDLERGQAVVRLGRAGDSFALRTFPPVEPETMEAERDSKERIIEATREGICRPAREVQREFEESQRRLEDLVAEAEAQERRAKDREKDAERRAKEQKKQEEKKGEPKAQAEKKPREKEQKSTPRSPSKSTRGEGFRPQEASSQEPPQQENLQEASSHDESSQSANKPKTSKSQTSRKPKAATSPRPKNRHEAKVTGQPPPSPAANQGEDECEDIPETPPTERPTEESERPENSAKIPPVTQQPKAPPPLFFGLPDEQESPLPTDLQTPKTSQKDEDLLDKTENTL